MRLTSILAIAVLSTAVFAQTPQPKTSSTPAPKQPAKATTPVPKTAAPAKAQTPAPKATAHTTPAKTAPAKAAPVKTTPAKAAPAKTSPAKITTKPAPKAAAPVKTAAKPATKPASKAATKPVAKTTAPAKPSAEKKEAPEIARTGRRDPFISPVRLAEERMKSNPACSTGARCLVINQLVLKGTVKTQSGMIAMVENAAKKQYNLHEKDTVQNGSVVRITTDSIVFQETTTDPLGRSVTKEVVKRVTVPAV